MSKAYAYILTNYKNNVLYVGATGKELKSRIWEHKEKLVSGFTKKYNVNKLVYFEEYETLDEAFNREKQLKGGSRQKKIDLVNQMNTEWRDLYDEI